MQAAEHQPALRKSLVQRINPERQNGRLSPTHSAYALAKEGQSVRALKAGGHGCCDSSVRYMFQSC